MSRRKGRSRRSRVYWRDRRGGQRAYGDFRDFGDVGGGREALIPRGAKLATADPDVAERLAAERVAELERLRRNKSLLGTIGAQLQDYAAHHLQQKARAGNVGFQHLTALESRLRAAINFLGAETPIDAIGTREIRAFMNHLSTIPNRRGGTLTGGARRHYLNALSNLYVRAQEEGVVMPGFNPARALMEKPQGRREEARWLEVHEAALLLESARLYRPLRPDAATAGAHVIVATLLLTGGRRSEVLGLDVDDVSFDRRTVTFRPNRWRKLKTLTSRRVVPLWPQLEMILREWVFERDAPLAGLLFPGRDGRMVGDLDKQLDAIGQRAGWNRGEIRAKALRHSYCAARLQSLDRGAPVSAFTVAREMGHGGLRLVERVYGHLGDVRHRSEVVEYRVEQHEQTLGERLHAVRIAPTGAAE